MNQKETFNSTVKNHHLNPLVSFDCRDDLIHLRKHFGAEDVERWVVKRDSPILGRAPDQTYLWSLCCCVLLILHVCCLFIILVSRLVLRWGCLIRQLSPRGLDEVVLHKETRVTNRRVALRCPR